MIFKRLIFWLILIIDCFVLNSQNFNIDNYVKSRLKKIGELNDKYFYNGFVIKNNDTIKCRIYLKKGKLTDDSFVFVIAKNSKDSLMIFTTNDITNYQVNEYVFQKFTSKSGVVFIRLLQKGNIKLFEKMSTPDNNEYTYYLFMPDNNIYYIEPFTDNVFDIYKEGHIGNRPEYLFSTRTKNVDQKFKYGISQILKDCPNAVMTVTSGYYGIGDIESIIKEYNNCK